MNLNKIHPALKEAVGDTWGKKFKKAHGNLNTFVKNETDDFLFIQDGNRVGLLAREEDPVTSDKPPPPPPPAAAPPEDATESKTNENENPNSPTGDGWTVVQRKSAKKEKTADAGGAVVKEEGQGQEEKEEKAPEVDPRQATYMAIEDVAAQRWGRWCVPFPCTAPEQDMDFTSACWCLGSASTTHLCVQFLCGS